MNETGTLLVRLSVAVLMVSYGIHQIIRPQAWLSYIPAWLQKLLPMSTRTFMKEHGAANFVLGGLLLLNIKPEWLYWIVLVWWLSILPFAFYEDWRSGMRDVVIIAGIIGLVAALYA
jgi:hypothetical protein